MMLPAAHPTAARRLPSPAIAACICLLAALIVGATAPPVLEGAEPERERQLVFSISPWTGDGYGGTFAGHGAGTIYLLAGVPNLVNVAVTDVYYWPLTGELRADWAGRREEIPGALEVWQGKERLAVLERVAYAFVQPREGTGPAQLVLGPDALAAAAAFQDAMHQYRNELIAHQQATAAYHAQLVALAQQVRATGRPIPEGLVPQPPPEPEPPGHFVTEPQKAFVIELPPGEYRLRYVDAAGDPVPHGEKVLRVITPRRHGVVYEIIPEHRWTRPLLSAGPDHHIYADGSGKQVLYIKPFQGWEVNRHDYARLTRLHEPLAGLGMQGSWQWVRGLPLDGVALEVVRGSGARTQGAGRGDAEQVHRRPYFVRQRPGFALGYRIVEFDPGDPHFAHLRPTFEAFRVEIHPGEELLLRLVDADGRVVPGSGRTVRSVDTSPGWAFYGIPLLPLAAALATAVRRRKP